MPESDLSAFILAGGRSSRMGEDKAFLELDGQTLLARALALAGSVAAKVSIVGDTARFAAYAPVVEDIYPGRGPLAGIHAALAGATTELNLVLAVDTPFLEEELLRLLVEQARSSGAVVTVPRVAGGFQPLCAVYRKPFAAVAEEALQQGRNKIDPLFSRVPTRILEPEELARFAFAAEMFDNLNTREDVERATRQSRKQP
jgi:molybdopterin-guanine dinucleotide biosynthesis protein A